MSTGQAIAGIR